MSKPTWELKLRNREGIIWSGSLAFVMMLALSLFSLCAWGLQYKLSLYRSPERNKPTMPAAKLLSPKERSVISTKAQVEDSHSKPLPVASIPFRAVDFRPSFDSALDKGFFRTQLARMGIDHPILYSRPPPHWIERHPIGKVVADMNSRSLL